MACVWVVWGMEWVCVGGRKQASARTSILLCSSGCRPQGRLRCSAICYACHRKNGSYCVRPKHHHLRKEGCLARVPLIHASRQHLFLSVSFSQRRPQRTVRRSSQGAVPRIGVIGHPIAHCAKVGLQVLCHWWHGDGLVALHVPAGGSTPGLGSAGGSTQSSTQRLNIRTAREGWD